MRLSSRLLRRTLGHTDERAKAESELLGAMDVVKCATWEVSQHSVGEGGGRVVCCLVCLRHLVGRPLHFWGVNQGVVTLLLGVSQNCCWTLLSRRMRSGSYDT